MAKSRPNILLITSDQQHWNTIGKHFEEVKTPNLDRLADQGMLARRAYCPNPTCTPTRSSIITGQYASRHGAWVLGTKLPETTPVVGDLLQSEGYDCSLIGKAHFQPLLSDDRCPSIEAYPKLRELEFWRDFNGPYYGFNHIELARNHGDECHVGQHYALWMEEKGFSNWRDHFQSNWGTIKFEDEKKNTPQTGAWSLPQEYHTNSWITERSIQRMRNAKDEERPFFLWSSYFDPHPPYLVPEPWASMYNPSELTVPEVSPGEHDHSPQPTRKTQELNPDFDEFIEEGISDHGFHSHLHDRKELAADIAIYYGMISFLDHHVGLLLDELDRLGLADNTMVIFTSDHGHYFGHHGLIAKGPFHYEDGIRVPFVARWPGRIPGAWESNSLISLVDLAPTILSATGIAIPSNMQGLDQLPVWEDNHQGIRKGAIVEYRPQPTTMYLKTYINDRYKITVYLDRDDGELYDLTNDPGEVKNLWHDPGSLALRECLLREMLFEEMRSEPKPFPRIAPA